MDVGPQFIFYFLAKMGVSAYFQPQLCQELLCQFSQAWYYWKWNLIRVQNLSFFKYIFPSGVKLYDVNKALDGLIDDISEETSTVL